MCVFTAAVSLCVCVYVCVGLVLFEIWWCLCWWGGGHWVFLLWVLRSWKNAHTHSACAVWDHSDGWSVHVFWESLGLLFTHGLSLEWSVPRMNARAEGIRTTVPAFFVTRSPSRHPGGHLEALQGHLEEDLQVILLSFKVLKDQLSLVYSDECLFWNPWELILEKTY